MDIIRIARADAILPTHLADLIRGVNGDVIVVQALAGIHAVGLACGIVIYAFIGDAQFIIGIGCGRIRVYPGKNIFRLETACDVIVTRHRNFNVIRLPYFLANLSVAGYGKRGDRFCLLDGAARSTQIAVEGQRVFQRQR